MVESKKIIYFLSHPIQYFSPLLKELAKQSELEVYYFSDISVSGGWDKGFGQKVKWDTPLLDGYKYNFLKNLLPGKPMNNRLWDVLNPGILKALITSKSDIVIVNGWSYSSTLFAVFFAKMLRKQVWLRAENPLNQELRKSPKLLFLKKILLGFFLFKFFVDKFLYIGSESKSFFLYYGVSEQKLLFTPYAVDNAYFSFFKEKNENIKFDIKKRLSVPTDKMVVLYSGKYISKKRPMDLIQAFHQCNRNDAVLVMVGEGELRQEMEAYIQKNQISNIILTGFINQSAMPDYYSICDLFVMCSGMGETWGLSVNEAMNFGKPVLVSETCGSSRDLIAEGLNGYTFKEGAIEDLSSRINYILNQPEFRKNAVEYSIKLVKEYSIENIVKNIIESK